MTRTFPAVCAALTVFAACSSRDFSDRKPVANSPVATPTASAPVASVATQTGTWCAQLPRPANTALPSVRTRSDWFHVYQAAPGVFALIESDQFQEAISYLIVGETAALMFDTGIGVVPIRPVIEELTTLPVTVVNSHSHYDHVGGNHEFARVLSMDTPFTRMKMAGRPHEGLAPGGEQHADGVYPRAHPLHEPFQASVVVGQLRRRFGALGERAVVAGVVATAQRPAVEDGQGHR